jgi:predicted nucleic acid-binding protein
LSYLSDVLPQGSPILDASVVINLLGTGAAADLLSGLGAPSLIEERTLREVLRHPLADIDLASALQDLQGLGLLQVLRMADVEYETYLGMVTGPPGTRLGIGESAAIAIAARGACLVLDDRKARRRTGSLPMAPPLATSLGVMLSSASRQGWSASRIRELIESARLHSRMSVIKEEVSLMDALRREQ